MGSAQPFAPWGARRLRPPHRPQGSQIGEAGGEAFPSSPSWLLQTVSTGQELPRLPLTHPFSAWTWPWLPAPAHSCLGLPLAQMGNKERGP